MDIIYYKDATDFLTHTGGYLSKDEALYGLILGLAKVVEINPHRYGRSSPWFCSINTGEKINTAAMRTPPHKVIIAHFSGNMESAVKKLADAVNGAFKTIPGVTGDKKMCDLFAGHWCREHRAIVKNSMSQRIYRLDQVNSIPLAPGRFRVATMMDKDLVAKWYHAFRIDTGQKARKSPETNYVISIIESEWYYIWELDGQPVSMAMKLRPTDNGMSVGGVYTPPEFRRKGYATSCVAELSHNILQSGKKFCMLYTDLANPVSNSIYMKIGYKAVGDSVEYTFKTSSKSRSLNRIL
jgi:uncharacterized protein